MTTESLSSSDGTGELRRRTARSRSRQRVGMASRIVLAGASVAATIGISTAVALADRSSAVEADESAAAAASLSVVPTTTAPPPTVVVVRRHHVVQPVGPGRGTPDEVAGPAQVPAAVDGGPTEVISSAAPSAPVSVQPAPAPVAPRPTPPTTVSRAS